MKNIPAIFAREMKAYFVSPTAYVALIVFTGLTGLFFAAYFREASAYQLEASMRVTIRNISITMLLVTPLITMRLFAEEKRSGTMEILMTSPVTDTEVVIGKFAASFALFVIMLALTFTCPLFLVIYSTSALDVAPIAVGYLGLLLLGAACLSLGIATSSITRNQMVAALTSFVMLLGLWIADWFSGAANNLLGKPLSAVPIGKILSFMSMSGHLNDFSKGILDTKHVVYYVSFAFFCLFLAIKSVQSAKWK